MLTKFKDYINENNKRKNIYAFSIFLFFTILTVCLNFVPAIKETAALNSFIPVWLQIASYITTFLYIILCIVCRVKHYTNTLRGIFFYQFPAIFFFIIELGLIMAGHSASGGFFLSAFNAWTFIERPLSYLITPFIGMSEMYTKLLVHMIFLLISGYSYVGIKNSIAFKEKIEEKQQFENR